MVEVVPQFKHDCDDCTFVQRGVEFDDIAGTHTPADYWYHRHGEYVDLVVRFGDHVNDYACIVLWGSDDYDQYLNHWRYGPIVKHLLSL